MSTISRRTFLKASGAAGALLPTIQLLGAAPTPSFDLADFCDTDAGVRYDMTRPFHQAGMTYATDARIAIRTELVRPGSDDPQLHLPPAADVFDKCQALGDWRPWPARQWVPCNDRFCYPCPVCFGDGRLGAVHDCERCGGVGATFCGATDMEFACEACQQTGKAGGERCGYCQGAGSVGSDVPSLQRIGKLVIAPRYDAKVRRLPGAEWRPVGGVLRDSAVVAFRCEGADGLLVPICLQ